MNTILISYDLRGPETSADYKRLTDKIKSYGTYCKTLESFWFVRTNDSAATVRNTLVPLLDSNDKIFTANVTGDEVAWKGLSDDVSAWIKAHL